MTVLNNKDSDRLEVVRPITDSDPIFFPILNRPHEDIEQRTKDLDRIFTPARGLRVRQTSTASTSVEVEVGIYLSTDGVTVNRSNSGSVQTIPIPASGAGQRRIDLIYFNLTTGVAARVASAEFPVATSFDFSLRPDLPAGVDSVPLALLYVDETPTPFDETITTEDAGKITDVRPAIGADRPLFSTSAPPSDTTSGSAGSATTVSRSDHRHVLNVDGTVPVALDISAASAGVSSLYARRDHKHDLDVETTAGNIQSDGTAAVGSSTKVVRSDHVHPLNVNDGIVPSSDTPGGAVGLQPTYARTDHRHPINVPTSGLPAALGNAIAATQGALNTYSRSDHVHDVTNLVLQQTVNTMSWSNDATSKTTGALGFEPAFAIVLFVGYRNSSGSDRPVHSVGVLTGTGSQAKSTSSTNSGSGSSSLWTASPDFDSAGGGPTLSGGFVSSHSDWELDATVFSSAGVTLDPTAAITGSAILLIVGQEQ